MIAGVDRLNDMAQTATNVTGDLFSATLVSDNEGLLDRSKWKDPAPEVTESEIPPSPSLSPEGEMRMDFPSPNLSPEGRGDKV